jgi:hypothetical protein
MVTTMMRRCIAVCVMSALLMLAPTRSQAQVAEVIWKCKSLGPAIGCLIFNSGLQKVVEVGIDVLADIALGRKKELGPKDYKPSKLTISEIEQDGIEWSKLREFLVSVFKSRTPGGAALATAQAREICRENWQPICRAFDVPPPYEEFGGCSKITTQAACGKSPACSWNGSVCGRGGGTRELFKK